MKMGLEQLEAKIPPAYRPVGRCAARPPVRWGRKNGDTDRWAQTCATGGAAVWAALAILARMEVVRLGAIELIFLFAALVIVPLGIELARRIEGNGRLEGLARRLQPLGAALAVAATCLPPGKRAALAATGWLFVCALMALDGVLSLTRLFRPEDTGTTLLRVTLAVARIDLAVAGAWLFASRLGLQPMGIQEPIGLLTAVHFHYAGFATATIAGTTLQFAQRPGRELWLKLVVLAVAGLPYLVAAGFVVAPALKMSAGLLFSASVAVLAVFLRESAKRAVDPTARVFLQIAAAAVFVAMLFSGAYAVADFLHSDALTIPQMARTHGILNSVGFCLPALLGWLIELSALGSGTRDQ